ncbi:hypothetical protein [Loktanella sp. 5RATIMAR09]|uniref:hypothetical protein n=1 Tax=Loktanella sp. 5RATIMAR09 TaxID=1225655 RepID=UPI0012EE39E9|nr:hypothetical protein [Loktanella sp. 5RATIMAR09]
MLETVALCTVLFDFSGLWISFLPPQMQDEVHAEIGFDPWDEEVIDAMSTALAAAASSDGRAGWLALHNAEKTYDRMSADEIVKQTISCGKRYSFLASQSD